MNTDGHIFERDLEQIRREVEERAALLIRMEFGIQLFGVFRMNNNILEDAVDAIWGLR
jgi:hypothetical protein